MALVSWPTLDICQRRNQSPIRDGASECAHLGYLSEEEPVSDRHARRHVCHVIPPPRPVRMRSSTVSQKNLEGNYII